MDQGFILMKSLLVRSCSESISTLTVSGFPVNSRDVREGENNLLRIEQRTYDAKCNWCGPVIHISGEAKEN